MNKDNDWRCAIDMINNCLQEGKKIQAIKAYRETFHCGLHEAKEAVDRMERANIDWAEYYMEKSAKRKDEK